MPSRSIPVVKHDKIAFFLWLNNIPIYICKYTTFSSFIYRWALRLLPYFGDCKQCCNEHEVNMFFELILLFYSDKYPEVELLDHKIIWGFSLVAQMIKNLPAMQDTQETGFDFWVRKILWRREWQSILVSLPGKFHGCRSLVGYSPQGHKRSDTTEQLTLSFFKVFFNLEGKRHTLFHSGCTNLPSHQQYPSIPFAFCPCQQPVISCLLGNSHSNQCEVIYLIVILICISPMISDIEHLLMYLLAIWMSYLKKIVIHIFCSLLVDCLGGFAIEFFRILIPHQTYDMQLF